MTSPLTPGIAPGRLSTDEIAQNFADLQPPLDPHEAAVAADRCYFCHDAPCTVACPTSIDIPMFIREIATGRAEGAAKTIFDSNILGGMCARVCPTEDLCEQACVREAAEGKPVEIGRLQRFATDTVMARQGHPFARAALTGKRVAVVGAGPAGLACAHRLAMHGHEVVIYEGRAKPGGLNEYGIAAYKATNDFAAREVEWLLRIGGITIETGQTLGREISVEGLTKEFDAVFLGVGLGGVNALRAAGEDSLGVADAVDFIGVLRQADDLTELPVGRNVVVIGGGMTAVDAAVQSKLLGADSVTIAYRRGPEQMSASRYEQVLAASKGVRILTNLKPVEIHGPDIHGPDIHGPDRVTEIALEYTTQTAEGLKGTGEVITLPADQVFKAIGQTLTIDAPVKVEGGKIDVTGPGRTSMAGVWAGGDCASGGDDLTVTAVAEGRDAAEDIHAHLMGGK